VIDTRIDGTDNAKTWAISFGAIFSVVMRRICPYCEDSKHMQLKVEVILQEMSGVTALLPVTEVENVL